MALRSDGTVLTWGDDLDGQLGIGRLLFRFTSDVIPGLSGIRSVSSRQGGGVLALSNDGRVFAWGDNQYGQAGDGTFVYHGNDIVSANISGVVAISAGGLFSMALKSDGTVWTWGDNSYGQLGDGSTTSRPSPGIVPGLADVIAISAGNSHSLALKRDGTAWAWGYNDSGRLGIGSTQDATRPVQVMNLSNAIAISAGIAHSLALRSDGTVWGWGYNADGRVGDGTTVNRNAASQAVGLSNIKAISAGGYHSAALRTDGTVWMWGNNKQDELALPPDAVAHAPAQVAGLAGVAAVSAGYEHTLALKNDGSVVGWGYNGFGELGQDNAQNLFIQDPTVVPGLTAVTDINTGYEVSFVVSAGAVIGWGKNNSQQLARGPARPYNQTTPVLVPGLNDVAAIACARRSSFALKNDGSLWAWGGNEWGVLGDGTGVYRSLPVRVGVNVLVPISAVSAASTSYLSGSTSQQAHVLALDRNGNVWVWGANSFGQLGNGTLTFTNGNTYWSPTPSQLTSLSGIAALSAGAFHSLALDTAGRVWAWGDNSSGELGDATTTQRATPVLIPGFTSIAKISAGWNFSLAISADRRAWSWGDEYGGQLGTGAVANQLTPVQIPGLFNVQSIWAGADHALAILGDGSLWAWGYNSYGQIGDGTLDERDLPVRIAAAGQVLSAVAGNRFTLAAAVGGAALEWGNNGNGQLGDGTLAYRTSPQLVLGVNGNGFLNLSPENPLQLPADKIPVFSVVASGGADAAAANVTANIQYRAQDVGSTGNVYVFAWAPANIVKNAVVSKAMHLGPMAKGGPKDIPIPCVLAQLTSSGQLTAVSASSLQAYVTGVLSSQAQAVTIINGVPTANIGGATFYVGYGSDPNAMRANGTNRSVVSVPGSVQCQPQAPQTGWWWNPAEGGRGFSIETQGNHLFMAGYFYDPFGRATWMVSGGYTSEDGSLFSGTMQSFSNGQTLTGAYKAPSAPVSLGAISLAFNDARHGFLSWPGGVVPIERFDSVLGTSTGPPPSFVPENGWWWSANESGRGYFLEFKNNLAFMAGYMYDASGNPLWYLSSGTMPLQQTFQGSWSQWANGQTMMGAYKPATMVNGNVGSLSIQFQDAANATMALPDGRQLPLTRFKF